MSDAMIASRRIAELAAELSQAKIELRAEVERRETAEMALAQLQSEVDAAALAADQRDGTDILSDAIRATQVRDGQSGLLAHWCVVSFAMDVRDGTEVGVFGYAEAEGQPIHATVGLLEMAREQVRGRL